jgi:DNA mismatch repair protein MutS2
MRALVATPTALRTTRVDITLRALPVTTTVTSPLPHPCSDKTSSDLEWPRVLEALADRCRGPMGRTAARELEFGATHEDIERSLTEAAEATRLRADGEPLAIDEVPEVTAALSRLRVGGSLAAEELRAVMRALGAARSLRRSLSARRLTCPTLYEACATDPTLDEALEELTRSFESDGSLSDRASPRLRELRSEYQASRARMLSRLEDLMSRYEGVLQDHFVTEREGRYVVPVRSDAHERFPGIVHATSGSGSTLFVEPRAVVPMGNRLKMLEAEVTREEIAIYARLSALLEDVLPSLDAAAKALAKADLRSAIAELAFDLTLTFPILDRTPTLDLKDARHPLLVLDTLPPPGERRAPNAPPARVVVASDLAVEARHAVVVSGPNAGGKTVALKAMGLAALMVRAGLPIACADESHIGLFEVVLTDVGDDQNLTKSLSTFSAHVQNLASILEETRPGALVLLDELAGGTDPREGEALAAGVLDSLCARGGAVVATTHYEGLKALALADDRFKNASVGFDLKTMTPTFRLTIGIPGSSSALAVAARFGLPSTVIERAARFLTREEHNFETLVKQLNTERAALELARQAADSREQAARTAETRLEEEIAAAKDREKRLLSREAEALMASLRRAKDDLRAAQSRLRTKNLDEPTLRETGRAIDRIAAQTSLGGELEELTMRGSEVVRAHVSPETLKRGARVYVPKLRAEAEVLEVSGNGQIRVTVGPMKLNVTIEELRAAEAEPPLAPGPKSAGHRPHAKGAASDGQVSMAAPIQTSDNTCDLRGLRADDAVAMATTFLDRSVGDGRRVAFLVHGHGTGSLREMIRKDLKASPYVTHFRAGGNGEGGDGVTVVWIA